MAQRGTDLDNIPDNNSRNKAKITDKITQFKIPEKTWVTLRPHGPIYTYAGYWVAYTSKDGKKSKFYTPCPSFDPETGQRDSAKYDPWRDLEATQMEVERDNRNVNYTTQGFLNMIYRKAQKDAPRKQSKHTKEERKSGFKDKDSDSYTPNVAVRLPFGALSRLKELSGLNPVEIKGQTKNFAITHPKYGRDVRIRYDSTKPPANQYEFAIGDKRTPLTEEELAYLKWDLSDLESAPTDKAEIKRDFESWATRNKIKLGKKAKPKDDDDEDDDLPEDDGDDDEDDAPKKGKGKKAKVKAKSKKSRDDDDEDDEDDEDLEEDDFDDAPPKKSKGKGKKAKDEDEEDDEDDEDDFGDDEDEDDDEPPKKSKAKAKGKKSKDEDEDEDDDLDDEDEDDEPAPKKGKAKAKAKGKKSKDEDDEDEDDFGDDDDEDDEPAPKKPKGKAKGKKAKDEDEDDEDDFGDDDDEDDEDEAPKKGKSKAKAKSKGKAKDHDDDFDDEDEDEDDEEDEPAPKKKKKSKK